MSIFQSHIIQKNDPNYDMNVRHIFPLRKPTDLHNDKIFNSAKTEKMTIQAIDKNNAKHKQTRHDKCFSNSSSRTDIF